MAEKVFGDLCVIQVKGAGKTCRQYGWLPSGAGGLDRTETSKGNWFLSLAAVILSLDFRTVNFLTLGLQDIHR